MQINSLPYERFSTRTRFETESENNMEIVHSILLPIVEAAWPTGQPPPVGIFNTFLLHLKYLFTYFSAHKCIWHKNEFQLI